MSKKNVLRIIVILLFIIAISLFYQTDIKSKTTTDTVSYTSADITSLVENMIKKCGWRSAMTATCYNKEFTYLTKTQSYKLSIAVLTQLGKKDGQVTNCHTIAHMISDAEIAKDYTKWRVFLESLENPIMCTRGLIHGTIEALLRYDPSFKFEPEYISELCYSLHGRIKGSAGEHDCSHGIGHILLVRYENNVEKAVKFCNLLDADLAYRCLDGLFMESILRDMLIIHGVAKPLPFTAKGIMEQEDICRQQEGLAAKACWKEMSVLYVFADSYTPSRLLELCHRAVGQDNQDECYLHGSFLAFTERVMPQKFYSQVCSQLFITDGLYHECLFRLFYNSNFASSVVANDALKFCSVQDKSKQGICCNMLHDRMLNFVSIKAADQTKNQCENHSK